jgi:hypothetical protein
MATQTQRRQNNHSFYENIECAKLAAKGSTAMNEFVSFFYFIGYLSVWY